MMSERYFCNICKETISKKVFEYSMDHYKKALCIKHQRQQKKDLKPNNFEKKYGKYKHGFVSQTDVKLYNALRKRNIKCEIAKFDGSKTVDISIDWAKINIEIDGDKHKINSKTLLKDIKRDEYSTKNGIYTIRLKNEDIVTKLEKIADAIADTARKRYFELCDTIVDDMTYGQFKEKQLK